MIWFVYLTALYCIGHLVAEFVPQDNYLINCGSTINTTVDNRVFIGDSAEPGLALLSKSNSISLRNPSSKSSPLYSTTRIFTTSSSYGFGIKKFGTHLVRFHFSPFSSPQFDFNNSNFSVLANGVPLLSNFGAKDFGVTVVKEFIIKVDSVELEVSFVPSKEQNIFAFVSAIEVFSAPINFFVDGVSTSLIVPNKGVKGFSQNISSLVLETVHRINVGGLKLTPFNDTLWRTWIPDEDFLVLKSAAKIATATHSPNYQPGGASEEIAPDNVYMTAQQMNKDNVSTVYNFNITWDFPVGPGDALHFVRLHFCDIVSLALNQLYFNVYINDVVAYKDLDLSSLTFHALASPYYLDFVVDSGHSGSIRISVGPSDLNNSLRKNAILNGVEIMSIKNFVDFESTGLKKRRIWILIGSVIGGFVVLCFVLLAGVVVLRRRRERGKPRRVGSTDTGWTPLRTYRCSSIGTMSEGTALTSPGPNGYHGLKIPYADLALATNNFDKDVMIGSGGFGMVYKAILKDNTKVAVKRGVPGSRQGLPEFHTEIAILSKIRHLHLVSLVGYCEEQSEMILVYEYMEKGTLKSHLYGPKLSPLSWKQRLEICIGAARGIHYLHTGSAQGIIHRDIKSTNILLDENYIAKVADFGLSRSGPCLNETHVSTGVKGSFGYLDPEYFRRRQLTDKSDVYSFGVVLFEVLCARPAVDPALEREQVNLGEWAIEWQKKGLLEQIIDPHLRGQIRPSSLKKFGETAEKCLADYAIDRPTMGDVLWNLEHALQLQENGTPPSPAVDNVTMEPPSAGDIHQVPAENIWMERETAEGSSNISTSRVFSQLIANDGR
ncbi:OLC1v1024668C1 [Oldenlandia corymbosa var. corymbosa]|uniref:OLC1v1024668C1 n=1 Tax=Oldenlandia corymbosa var. corymbosa TaxID=529605 RepID=A0AAV1C5Z1_OLDCO|nr:OLC1v1024668C1 [Oldenlandia corymbosa var. corymbosa]